MGLSIRLRFGRWLGSLEVRASDLRLNGYDFDSGPSHYWLVRTEMGGHTSSICNQPPRSTQPPTLCETGNEYQPKRGDALRLGVKAGLLIPFVAKCVGGR